MAEGLKLVVTADMKQAEKALKDFTTTAATEGKKAGDALGSGLNKSVPVIKNIPKATQPAVKAISHLGDSIETLRGKLLAKKEFLITSKDVNQIIVYNAEIKELETEIARIKSLGSPTFNNLTQSVTKTGLSFNTISAGANKAFSVLRQAAYILPGIGIAGILGGISGALVSMISGADDAKEAIKFISKEVDEARAKQEYFAEAVDKAAGSIVGQAAKLADLRAILTTTDNATVKLTQSTIRQGIARLVFDEKNVEVQKLLNAEIQKAISLQKTRNPFIDVKELSEASITVQRLTKQIDDLRQKNLPVPNVLNEQLASAKAIEASTQNIGVLNNLGKGLEEFFNVFIDGSKKAKKETDDILETAKQLAAFLDRNTQFAVSFEIDPLDSEAESKRKAKEFIDKARSFIENQTPEFQFKPIILTEFGLKFDKRIIENIQEQAGIEATKTYKEVKKAFEENIKRLAENNPITVEVTADVNAAIRKENQNRAELASGLGLKIPGANEAVSTLTKIQKESIAAAGAINGVLTPAFQGLFNSILAGESPLKAFFDSLGQAVLQLIQKLIAAAIQAAILSAIFPAGVGGVKGFGGFFKNIAGFAAGGLVSGPTLGLIGEGPGTSRSNPEVIAPLDQLRGMLAGLMPEQPQTSGRSRIVIRGTDIRLSSARQGRRNGRLGG